jgi:hypothetical protein
MGRMTTILMTGTRAIKLRISNKKPCTGIEKPRDIILEESG